MHNIDHHDVGNDGKLVKDGPASYAACTWNPILGCSKRCVSSWWIWWIYNKLFVPSRVSYRLEVTYALKIFTFRVRV